MVATLNAQGRFQETENKALYLVENCDRELG